jgi:hypothetical protein
MEKRYFLQKTDYASFSIIATTAKCAVIRLLLME